ASDSCANLALVTALASGSLHRRLDGGQTRGLFFEGTVRCAVQGRREFKLASGFFCSSTGLIRPGELVMDRTIMVASNSHLEFGYRLLVMAQLRICRAQVSMYVRIARVPCECLG